MYGLFFRVCWSWIFDASIFGAVIFMNVCCVLQSPPFKFSRKASSSYSLKLDNSTSGKQKVKVKRKPLSTPASPSRAREPQCTCMTPEQYARLKAQDPRYRKLLATRIRPFLWLDNFHALLTSTSYFFRTDFIRRNFQDQKFCFQGNSKVGEKYE